MLDPTRLPTYVGRGGEQVYRPPYEAKSTRLFGFMLEADIGCLGATLDRYLNDPSDHAVDYQPAAAYVMLYFASLDHTRSAEPPDSELGWFNEHEVGIFMLAHDAKNGGLVVYVPYIFVEASQTMVGGREIYGFPKQLGDMDMPLAGRPADSFELRARAADQFAPDTELVMRRVITVSPNPATLPGHHTTDARSAASSLLDPSRVPLVPPSQRVTTKRPHRIEAPLPPAPPPLTIRQVHQRGDVEPAADPSGGSGTYAAEELAAASAQTLDLAQEVIEGRIPMVFLKQFRDVQYPARACYQAITEMSNQESRFRSLRMLDGDLTVDIADLDSLPIAHELGLRGGPITPTAAFELDFDFVVPPGRVLWRAGNTEPS